MRAFGWLEGCTCEFAMPNMVLNLCEDGVNHVDFCTQWQVSGVLRDVSLCVALARILGSSIPVTFFFFFS